MLHRRSLIACTMLAAICAASPALAQSRPVPSGPGIDVNPRRMMQVRFEQKDGQIVRVTPLSGWIEYKENPIRPSASTNVAVDHFEFTFNGTGGIQPDQNPAYGPGCGLPSPTSRYWWGAAAANPLVYDDIKCAPGTANANADRVAFGWGWQPAAATQCYVAVFTTENWVVSDGAGANDPNSAAQRNDIPGIVYDFAVLAPGAGYYYADIDLTGSGLSHKMPAAGFGGKLVVLANAFAGGQLTLANHPCQLMLWFTKALNPSWPLSEFQWDDRATTAGGIVDGTWNDPIEWVNYFFPGTCPPIAPDEKLGAMIAFLVPNNQPEVVVPSTFTTIRGRHDSGNVGSLAADDNNYLRHCKFIVPNTLVPPIEVQVNGTTTKTSTTGVTAQLTGKMANAGSFTHTVEQRNQVSLAYEDGATAAVNTTESTITSNSTGNHNEKIGTGGALQARYFIRRTGPSAVAAFCYDAEWFRWTVN